MSAMKEMQIETFLEELASSNPTPGGGGVSALCGAIAAALTSMLTNLTIGKKNYLDIKDKLENIIKEATELRSELLALIDGDAEVFSKFMACYKMPQNTEEQKADRAEALQKVTKEAAEVPMEIGRKSFAVIKLAEEIVNCGNPMAITDGTISAILARAAMRSAFYNVIINLKLIKDEEFNNARYAEMAELEEKAQAIEEAVTAKTASVLG